MSSTNSTSVIKDDIIPDDFKDGRQYLHFSADINLTICQNNIDTKWEMFSYIMKKTSNVLMKLWCLACTKTNMLSWIFWPIAHWNNSPKVDMSFHIDTLSWLKGNQSMLLPTPSCGKHQILLDPIWDWTHNHPDSQGPTNHFTIETVDTIKTC